MFHNLSFQMILITCLSKERAQMWLTYIKHGLKQAEVQLSWQNKGVPFSRIIYNIMREKKRMSADKWLVLVKHFTDLNQSGFFCNGRAF